MDQRFDHVVIVDDNVARDCLFFAGGRDYIHCAFEDPASCTGSEDEVIEFFRRVRVEIKTWIEEIFGGH